jgi:outer membrane protein assembly factor BamD
MFARAIFVAILPLVTFGSAAMNEEVTRSSEDIASKPSVDRPTCTGLAAECQMEIGRYYVKRGNLLAATNRFKVVVTRYPSSVVVDEALFRLVQVYVMLGIRNEAQTAAAVLDRKFPESSWRSDALDILKKAGFEPAEDEKSWISIAFQ